MKLIGFVDDRDKFDVVAGATALIMPSYYESLSMVALEAWALGTPVIANAHCDVLLGQCLRSNAGLYYADADEFGAVLDRVLDGRPSLVDRLGRNGRAVLRTALQLAGDRKKISGYVRVLSSNPAGAPDGAAAQDGSRGGKGAFAPPRRSWTNCRQDRSSIVTTDESGGPLSQRQGAIA